MDPNYSPTRPSLWTVWLDGFCIGVIAMIASTALSLLYRITLSIALLVGSNQAAAIFLIVLALTTGPIVLSKIFRAIDGRLSPLAGQRKVTTIQLPELANTEETMTDDLLNADRILYRCIGDSWYVLQCHMSDEYSDANYKRDEFECAN